MAGESDQVCHAYHDLHEILISPQICILCSSGDNECNGTVIDGNWSIIVGAGYFVTEVKRE